MEKVHDHIVELKKRFEEALCLVHAYRVEIELLLRRLDGPYERIDACDRRIARYVDLACDLDRRFLKFENPLLLETVYTRFYERAACEMNEVVCILTEVRDTLTLQIENAKKVQQVLY